MVYTGRCEACDDAQVSKFFTAGGWLIVTFFGLIAILLYMRARCTKDDARRYFGTSGWHWRRAPAGRPQVISRRPRSLEKLYPILNQGLRGISWSPHWESQGGLREIA